MKRPFKVDATDVMEAALRKPILTLPARLEPRILDFTCKYLRACLHIEDGRVILIDHKRKVFFHFKNENATEKLLVSLTGFISKVILAAFEKERRKCRIS